MGQASRRAHGEGPKSSRWLHWEGGFRDSDLPFRIAIRTRMRHRRPQVAAQEIRWTISLAQAQSVWACPHLSYSPLEVTRILILFFFGHKLSSDRAGGGQTRQFAKGWRRFSLSPSEGERAGLSSKGFGGCFVVHGEGCGAAMRVKLRISILRPSR